MRLDAVIDNDIISEVLTGTLQASTGHRTGLTSLERETTESYTLHL